MERSLDEIFLRGHHDTPLYVYDLEEVRRNFHTIKGSIPYENTKIFYAMMANNNRGILRELRKLGCGVQVNSFYELEQAKRSGFKKEDISFTSTGLSGWDLRRLIMDGIQMNIDSVEEIEKSKDFFPNDLFGVRLSLHPYPVYGRQSPEILSLNIGIEHNDPRLEKYLERINGVHGYVGTNLENNQLYKSKFNELVRFAKRFPNLSYINVGGGFGINPKDGSQAINWKKLGKFYSDEMTELSEWFGKKFQLRLEPGRALVASAGTLYTRVTNVKSLGSAVAEVSVDSGFGEFARPYIYGAQHSISLVGGNESGVKLFFVIRGNTCLQEDFLVNEPVFLPPIKEGDILAIHNVGAYGRVMASGFPGKRLPQEIVI